MNTQFQRSMLLPTITRCAVTLAGRNVFGLGGDYANGQPVNQPAWPVGMADLVNTESRIGGMFVSAEDVFFYSGTASEFSAFLDGYSKIQNLERHRVILHRGAGETGSLTSGSRRPCDWKLQGRPGASGSRFLMGMATYEPRYVLEVHFWTGGRIALDEVVIPKSVEMRNSQGGAI
jgi:hypothetical protein